ncbi:hypothetical protein BJV77DRAFT_1150622 [Russula vinacea]|nr:hypothetical protein BJV77DRAFT_1150622 [Russula vinacea]
MFYDLLANGTTLSYPRTPLGIGHPHKGVNADPISLDLVVRRVLVSVVDVTKITSAETRFGHVTFPRSRASEVPESRKSLFSNRKPNNKHSNVRVTAHDAPGCLCQRVPAPKSGLGLTPGYLTLGDDAIPVPPTLGLPHMILGHLCSGSPPIPLHRQPTPPPLLGDHAHVPEAPTPQLCGLVPHSRAALAIGPNVPAISTDMPADYRIPGGLCGHSRWLTDSGQPRACRGPGGRWLAPRKIKQESYDPAPANLDALVVSQVRLIKAQAQGMGADMLQHWLYAYSDRSGGPEQRRQSRADAKAEHESR